MKTNLFYFIRGLTKFFRIIIYFIIGVTFIGLTTLILNRKTVLKMMIQENMVQTSKIPFIYYILILIIAIAILVSFIYLLHKVEQLIINFSKDDYFTEDNISLLQKIILAIIIWTSLQAIALLSFQICQVNNVSVIFNLTLKDYTINIIFLTIAYISKLTIHRGIQLKKITNPLFNIGIS